MRHGKKLGALLLALALVLSMFAVPAEVQAATKKTTLNKTKATLTVGQTLQ